LDDYLDGVRAAHSSDLIFISYHVNWPQANDPYYLYNSAESNARRTFYGVSAVPFVAMNGAEVSGSQTTIGNALINAIGGFSALEISATGEYIEWNRAGNVTVTLDNTGTLSGSYVLRTALIEENLYYMGTNGHPNHYATMRDMIPTANGVNVTLTPNTPTYVDLDFAVPEAIVQENALLVFFLQHPTNKSVVNAMQIAIPSLMPDCPNPPGDVGGDMVVNVQDIVQIVSVIIGTTSPEGCMIQAADLNDDETINVQDVVMLVSMILGN